MQRETQAGSSRRAFLKVAATAAVAAPYVITSGALGGNGRPPASERITMGFIGVGTQGGGHLLGGAWTYVPGGYLARPDVQILGVCDVRKERRESVTRRVEDYYGKKGRDGAYKGCEAYLDFRELLARDDIDAVLIGTPIHWHAMMTTMAARAGKDVYCEKPTALTVSESRAVVETVRRYGRVFQAGTQQRSEYGGKYRLACELVRSGRIGQLKEVYAYERGGGYAWNKSFGPGKPNPDPKAWDLYLGPAPDQPYDGNFDAHRFGNGGINWGQHHYDIVQWGIPGADDADPVELDVKGDRSVMRYASGVTVHGAPYPDPSLGLGPKVKFQGEGGVVFVGTEGKIAVDRQQIQANPTDILQRPLTPDDQRLYFAQSHSGNFIECVKTRKRTICDVGSSHRSAKLLLLAGIVETLKRPLKWDGAAERFVGDDEANRMLSVAYRAPWRM